MVPLRFVSEQLGATVDWDNDTFTAILTSPRYPGAGAHARHRRRPPSPRPRHARRRRQGVCTGISVDASFPRGDHRHRPHIPEYRVVDIGRPGSGGPPGRGVFRRSGG